MGETNAFTMRLGSGLGRLDGGLNVTEPAPRLDSAQASRAENVWYDAGALRRRPGFAALDPLGTGAPVDTLHDDGSGRLLLQSGSKLYAWTPGEGAPQAFWTLQVPVGAEKAPKGSFLPYKDGWVYFINGVEYIRWNGTTAEAVTPTAPKLYVFGSETVTGAVLERNAPNLLTNLVTLEYRLSQENAVNRVYLPPEVRADINPVSVTVNGEPITDISVYAGHVNLGTSYAGTSTIRVVTELKSTFQTGDMGVRACVCAADFGTQGRVFLCGNGTNRLYASAAFDPAYFPADCVQAFGPGEPLTGLGKLYGTLIVFRAHGMAEIGDADFALRTVNPVLGCDMPGSICTVGNRLLWANTYAGVHMLVSTSRESERNVQNLSRNIDPLLLAESAADLTSAVSVDFGGRYWLCAGSHVYVWDYTQRPYTASAGAAGCAWYLFTGIQAAHFFVCSGSLHFIGRGSDALRRFERRGDDAGQAFAAFWRTGMLDGGHPDRYKHLDRLRLTLLRDEASRFTVTVRCDEEEEARLTRLPETVACKASETGQTLTVGVPLRRRGLVRFSLEFACPETDAGLALADAAADCRLGARIVRY